MYLRQSVPRCCSPNRPIIVGRTCAVPSSWCVFRQVRHYRRLTQYVGGCASDGNYRRPFPVRPGGTSGPAARHLQSSPVSAALVAGLVGALLAGLVPVVLGRAAPAAFAQRGALLAVVFGLGAQRRARAGPALAVCRPAAVLVTAENTGRFSQNAALLSVVPPPPHTKKTTLQ